MLIGLENMQSYYCTLPQNLKIAEEQLRQAEADVLQARFILSSFEMAR